MTTSVGPPRDSASLEAMCVELAQGAAQLVIDARGTELAIATKSTTTDLVTAIDRRVERWLIEQIAQRRPGDAVLGEEGGASIGSEHGTGVRWVLDPIDGTVNFVLGLPQFAISVAAEVEGEVIAGAVCNPVTGETFRAALGGGAHLGDQRLDGPRAVSLEQAVVGTGFAYDSARRRRQIEVLVPLLPQVADIRRLGSASLDLCFVAAGRLDGYFESGLNYWDWAAGVLIAAEAGCVVSGLRDRPPSGNLLVAAGPGLAPLLLDQLELLRAGETDAGSAQLDTGPGTLST